MTRCFVKERGRMLPSTLWVNCSEPICATSSNVSFLLRVFLRYFCLGTEWKLHKVYLCQVYTLYILVARWLWKLCLTRSVSLSFALILPILCRCPCSLYKSAYFASMFSGHWRESNQSEVSLDIPDPNITSEGDQAVGLAEPSLLHSMRYSSSFFCSTWSCI